MFLLVAEILCNLSSPSVSLKAQAGMYIKSVYMRTDSENPQESSLSSAGEQRETELKPLKS